MSEHYVFFRCWHGFRNGFPFDQFNHLPDDEIRPALDEHAREWLRENRSAAKDTLRKRKTDTLSHLKRREKRFLARPNPHPGTHPGKRTTPSTVYTFRGLRALHSDSKWSHRDRQFCSRVGEIAGWGGEVDPRSECSPSPRLLIQPVSSHEAAQAAADALQKKFGIDHRDLGFLILRFGHIPSDQIAMGDRILAKLAADASPDYSWRSRRS